jgi:sugar lactone lactonase YvrE
MVALRHTRILLAVTVLAVIVPVAMSLAQPAPAPAGPPAASGRGAAAGGGGRGQPGDYNKSMRSDADKALVNPYALNQTWYTMPKGRFLGSSSAIDIDKDGKSVWIAERCGGQDLCAGSHVDPIMKFSADGKFLKAFGKDMLSYPHGIYVDKEGNIFVTDLQSNLDNAAQRNAPPNPAPDTIKNPAGAQVLKFSPDGKLLLRIGTPGVYGNDATHFSQPSDVVTDDAGNIYVADGHDTPPANNRVAKFDKTGKFLKQWPTCLANDRQLDCSHSIAIDKEGEILVANRGNGRIDIYDQDGKLLRSFEQFGKSGGLWVDKNDVLYSADSESGVGQGMAFVRGIHIGDLHTGEVKYFIPDALGAPAPWNPLRGTSSPEGVAVDKDGSIYISAVTPPGMARYTLNPNIVPTNSQGIPAGGRSAGGRGQ